MTPIPEYISVPKACAVCGEYPPTTNGRCSKCRSAYNRQWYEKNREEQKVRAAASNRKRRKTMRQWVKELKSNPCTDCGKRFPVEAMEFDHFRGEKKFSIGRPEYSKRQDFEAEISKCQLVCSNCHKIRTASRRRAKLAEQLPPQVPPAI